jgi:hypothetical protein
MQMQMIGFAMGFAEWVGGFRLSASTYNALGSTLVRVVPVRVLEGPGQPPSGSWRIRVLAGPGERRQGRPAFG